MRIARTFAQHQAGGGYRRVRRGWGPDRQADMEDVVSTNREIEASEPARATAAGALPRTDAVPEG